MNVGKAIFFHSAASIFPEPLNSILENTKRGLIVFSLGTVSNTTNMPKIMIVS